ncbi:MAG TPA: hypothetical protein PLH37_02410 [bacterium]|nr:hypothetical protein [bacterium]
MNSEKLKKIILKYGLLAGSLLALLIIFFITVIPSVKKIILLNNRIFEERKQLEEIYLKGQSLTEAKEKYTAVKKETTQLDDVFITKGNELGLITALEKIADNNKVIQNLDIDNKKTDPQTKILISLEVRGTYRNLLNYLQAIEALNLYFNIENGSFANFASNTQNNDNKNISLEPTLTLRLGGYVYYRD